jgi:hypothetical protein
MAQNISQETQTDALKVAKAIQKPGQTKEQTKLIAQGIEKGISEYKKQQKAKARERDKQRKLELKNKSKQVTSSDDATEISSNDSKVGGKLLPWGLLLISWTLFTIYFFTS